MTDVLLLTGGRAPATLDLARRLREGGAEVHLAESLAWTATSLSRAVTATHRVRPPRQDPDGFLEDLRRLCAELGVDLLLPTCEEVFWVARGPDLPTLLESRERLRRVHDKQTFIAWAQELGLAVPETRRAADRASLEAAVAHLGGPDQVVIKPIFSRFATSTVVRPDAGTLAAVMPSTTRPWAVQRYVGGPVACTWSVAHQGRLTVHTAYRARFTAGPGSAVHFATLDDDAVLDWVRAFAEGTRWTGQLAFDFVLTDDGPVAIECNPRLTSGVHLLRDGPALLRALRDPDAPLLTAPDHASAQISAGMWLYALPRSIRHGELREWWRATCTSREVSYQADDLRPLLLQPLSVGALLARAVRVGEGVLDATTWDIRWDGEEDPG